MFVVLKGKLGVLWLSFFDVLGNFGRRRVSDFEINREDVGRIIDFLIEREVRSIE